MAVNPSLFGIKRSNRDFSDKESWGKNQFNSSFPASLTCYLDSKGLENIYITLDDDLKIDHQLISTQDLFKISPKSDDIFFAFETPFSPFQKYVIGVLPRVDLVIQDINDGSIQSGIEVKLTALPDNSTCDMDEEEYGCEIVVRPDTIVYLACSIAQNFENNLNELIKLFNTKFLDERDWSDARIILPDIEEMVEILDNISEEIIGSQKPLIMQPIWKTEGKSPRLADNCLDVFIWSDLSFMQLFLDAGRNLTNVIGINRQVRTIIWLFKMLLEFSQNGQFNHVMITDRLSYNTRNDKAFAVNGSVTHFYMNSEYLITPRITKNEIKKIILGGGQNMLSPERRFDAIIYNSPELFE